MSGHCAEGRSIRRLQAEDRSASWQSKSHAGRHRLFQSLGEESKLFQFTKDLAYSAPALCTVLGVQNAWNSVSAFDLFSAQKWREKNERQRNMLGKEIISTQWLEQMWTGRQGTQKAHKSFGSENSSAFAQEVSIDLEVQSLSWFSPDH